MRPKSPSSKSPPTSITPSLSEEASAPGIDDEKKSDMLNIYLCIVDALLRAADIEQAHQLARSELTLKLNQRDAIESQDMRSRLLKHFQTQGKEARDLVGLFRLLDVVLDDNMDLVEIACRDEDGSECFDNRIFPVLVNRCPGLRKLHLRCANGLADDWPETLGFYISQFGFLTTLHLDKVPIQCKTIIYILGKSCPQLSFLRLGFDNLPLTTDEFLGIFYSGDLDTLKNVAPDVPSTEFLDTPAINPQKAYHHCFVPPHLLHSFCQTLEEIRINYFKSDDPSVIAFILRHLPRLQKLETSDFEFKDYSASIRALWDIQEGPCQEAATSTIQNGKASSCSTSDSIVLAKYDGKLALTNLFAEGDKDYLTFKSVCDLCPRLQKLHLLEASVCDTNGTETTEVSEIANDFKKLTQLRVLTCTESDGPLCCTITQATASFLTTLEVILDGVFIPKFDFLLSCTNLKVLKLSTEFHPPLKSYFGAETKMNLNAEMFLPKLEEVQLDFCMNSELEELFLTKSTLKHVDILCLHHLGQTDEQFFELFLQWPELVSFKYKMPRKFTVDMGLKILSHLPKLRSLSLFKDIKYRCSGDFNLLKKTCRQRNVKLDLHLFVDTYLCIDGDVNGDRVSTSDESETDP